MSPQCETCGRFLSRAFSTVACDEVGWFIQSVIGDCKRCGEGVVAMRGYCYSWDYWDTKDVTA